MSMESLHDDLKHSFETIICISDSCNNTRPLHETFTVTQQIETITPFDYVGSCIISASEKGKSSVCSITEGGLFTKTFLHLFNISFDNTISKCNAVIDDQKAIIKIELKYSPIVQHEATRELLFY